MWQIEKTTKRCQNCTRTIETGKDYFSALFQNQAAESGKAAPGTPNGARPKKAVPSGTNASGLMRQDFCTNCWERRTASGEESPFSFWQTRIAAPSEPPKTPRQVLLTFFDNLFIEPVESKENTVGEGHDKPKSVVSVSRPHDSSPPEADLPQAQGSQKKTASETVLTATADSKLKSQVKYLFSLILLRKRLLKLKESIHKDNMKFLVFERVSDNKIYEIQEIDISEQELISLRDEFSKLFEFRI
jgi:hypothetical protein